MESDYNQGLPDDILEKLRNLELELEDGDITLKGFEKKKASLLADISNPSSPVSPTNQKSEAELLAELGPEPSAADVVDFLDFLPSPTHSPTRTVEAVNHMEENHRQMQQQAQPQIYPAVPSQQQQQYQPSPQLQQQQQQYISPQQQQQMRPMQPQYRPYPPGGVGRGNNTGPYYGNTNMGSPLPNNRPYMVRNNYPQQQPPQSQMGRPMGPPGSNPYYGQRPPSSIPPQNAMYRPQQQPYNSNQPRPQITTSPRPMYRPQPRPNGGYRPQQPQYMQSNGQPPLQQQQPPPQQSQQHGNYYSSGTPGGNGSGVSINRSLSGTSSMGNNNMAKQYDQQQRQYLSMHSTRNDSMEWNRQ
ncbi:hypothetical protein MAM1_0109c05503 [Mucor ambiguus]|uniref:DMAP1-binding domain-containing protein n=1 Tax=Mucor ambiguus TaxID=91626 RepID=A0A0C9MRT2_9FUNG|nr:hypothetical protein MAM1_0109c05503 [Mucor ambiguus]